MAEDMHRADDLDPRRVQRHEDLALLFEGLRVRAGLDHGDHDLAARIASAGDIEFLAIDDPFVSLQHRLGRNVLGVRRGDIRLGHRIGRADLAGQQGLQPLFLLLGRADALQHFHIAGIGRRAVQRLARQRVLAQLRRDIGIVEIVQPFAGLGIRQEEVPESAVARLLLSGLQQFELPRRIGPAVGAPFAQPEILLGDRIDILGDVLDDRIQKGTVLVGHAQIVEVAVDGFGSHGCLLGLGAVWICPQSVMRPRSRPRLRTIIRVLIPAGGMIEQAQATTAGRAGQCRQ